MSDPINEFDTPPDGIFYFYEPDDLTEDDGFIPLDDDDEPEEWDDDE